MGFDGLGERGAGEAGGDVGLGQIERIGEFVGTRPARDDGVVNPFIDDIEPGDGGGLIHGASVRRLNGLSIGFCQDSFKTS